MSGIVSLEGLKGSDLVARDIADTIRHNVSDWVDPAVLQALADVGPPLNNMGGNLPFTPLFIPLCEKELEKLIAYEERVDLSSAQKTTIDWLGFSSIAGIEAIREALRVVWPDLVSTSSGAGMRGYPKCHALMVNGVQYGLLGFGAKHGRDSVSLTGIACKTLNHELLACLYEALQLIRARLSRLDIAFDLYRGEMTFDYALFAYERGDFKSANGGSQPKKRVITEDRGDGQNLGRTMYVGARDGEVMARVYEKGLEVFARMDEAYREASTERERLLIEEGKAQWTIADDWLRLEVEFKFKDKERLLPLEMLLDRDTYFAGAYPFFAAALGKWGGKRPATLKTDAEIDLDKMIAEMRRAYGNTVYSLTELGFTPAQLVEMVTTGRHNQKLVRSGLLNIIKNDPAWISARAACDDIPF